MMEQETAGNGNNGNNGHGRVTFVNVMTHEQIEMLRIQIAIYAAITEQLAEMHKNQTPQPNLAGVRMGNLYCNPQMTHSGQKICVRQRWTPTPAQLQILEELFAESTGTPSKQKINEITSELSQHGQINENNVYNWFQNRRARWKRKQQQDGTSNNAEPEVATASAASSKDKGKRPLLDDQLTQSQQNSSAQRAEDLCFQNPEGSSDPRFLHPQAIKEGNLFASTIGLRAFQ